MPTFTIQTDYGRGEWGNVDSRARLPLAIRACKGSAKHSPNRQWRVIDADGRVRYVAPTERIDR